MLDEDASSHSREKEGKSTKVSWILKALFVNPEAPTATTTTTTTTASSSASSCCSSSDLTRWTVSLFEQPLSPGYSFEAWHVPQLADSRVESLVGRSPRADVSRHLVPDETFA